MGEFVRPENLVNTISQNLIKEFRPILVTDVFGLMNVLIRF